jgi:hypothetical protein
VDRSSALAGATASVPAEAGDERAEAHAPKKRRGWLASRRPVVDSGDHTAPRPRRILISRCYSGHSPPAPSPTPRSMIPGSLTDYGRHLHHCSCKRSPPPSERQPVHPDPLARNQVEPRTTAAEWKHVWSVCTSSPTCSVSVSAAVAHLTCPQLLTQSRPLCSPQTSIVSSLV